ncbi:hypothetical protein EUGRSUZ_H00991 [Eucalyptus grandis]|uniref:Uncharacterized protein n=2 Tax=Eucalyptus grandis TaxID=71139 RepID=A0ACC3KCF6_EUCGR|nr:hypothetical protein EUGRSUZ_H00991 [Eucalyptus grandis]
MQMKLSSSGRQCRFFIFSATNENQVPPLLPRVHVQNLLLLCHYLRQPRPLIQIKLAACSRHLFCGLN